jgi:hypothetical protein
MADEQMAGAFEGFLTRDRFHLSLGISHFDFDPDQDIIVAGGNHDPGVWTRAHELLQPYLKLAKRAVVVLDEAWEGSPGATKIVADISANLQRYGWTHDRFCIIVIQPELENWIWQDNDHVATTFGFESMPDLRVWLGDRWKSGSPKPDQPKEVLEAVGFHKKMLPNRKRFVSLTSRVSIRNCSDPSFHQLCDTLREWFPV